MTTTHKVETKKCPLCAEDIQLEAKLCRYCGARFEISLVGNCTTCRKQTPVDSAGLCTACGGVVTDQQINSRLIEEAVAPRPRGQPYPPAAWAPSPGAALATTPQEMEICERKGEGVMIRFTALIGDVVVVGFLTGMVLLAITIVLGSLDQLSSVPLDALTMPTLFTYPIIWVIYFTIFEGAFGTTVGKTLSAWPWKLRVVKKDGSPCGFGAAAIRAVMNLFEGNPIGAVVIWSTNKHQRLGDLMAGTVVVDARKLTRVSFRDKSALFEFADGRRAEVGKLTRGEISKWFQHVTMIKLEGVTPEGQPVKLSILDPGQEKRQALRSALSQFFEITFSEHFQWWRLLVALLTLVVGLALILGTLMIGSTR